MLITVTINKHLFSTYCMPCQAKAVIYMIFILKQKPIIPTLSENTGSDDKSLGIQQKRQCDREEEGLMAISQGIYSLGKQKNVKVTVYLRDTFN